MNTYNYKNVCFITTEYNKTLLAAEKKENLSYEESLSRAINSNMITDNDFISDIENGVTESNAWEARQLRLAEQLADVNADLTTVVF